MLSAILLLPLTVGNFATASEVTGTLSTAVNSVGNTLTGTVLADNNILTGTVTAPLTNSSYSGGGGGGGHVLPKSRMGDANKDGRVDILDFVKLMADWDKDGDSDFNGDGHADILDFVTLMANWTK